MKIYISGGIHNQPVGVDGRKGSDAFRNVANLVSQLGHIPVVPHDIPPIHRSHGSGNPCPPAYSKGAACYMRGDLIEMLGNCDAILMIGEWQHSVGAQREHSVACWTGMPIFYDARSLPDNRPYDGEPFKSHLEHVQAVEAKRVSGSYCPTCGRPPHHEETWCANAFHIQGPPRMKVSKEGLALARELSQMEIVDDWSEYPPPLTEEQRQNIRESAVGTNDAEDNEQFENVNLSKFSDQLRRYGQSLIAANLRNGEVIDPDVLLNFLANWVAGERL